MNGLQETKHASKNLTSIQEDGKGRRKFEVFTKILKLNQEVKRLFLFTTIEFSQVRKKKEICVGRNMHNSRERGCIPAIPWIANKFREVWGNLET